MDFHHLYKQHFRPLCLYALHYLGDVGGSEDVVQECFVRLYEYSRRQPVGHPKGWLYQAVRHRCIDVLKSRLRAQADATLPLDALSPHDSQGLISDDEAQRRSEREACLWTAIEALPPRRRQVLLLVKRDGLSYREAAETLHISERTVEHQLAAALKTLRGQHDDILFVLAMC